jgi:hypothetical protein
MQPDRSDPSLPSNWRASTGSNGSPAADDRLRFAAWQLAHFSPGDPGYPELAAPLADPDGDGFQNVVEFFIGTNPKIPTPAPAACMASVQMIDAGNGPQNFAVFSFRHVKAAEEVVYIAETTSNFTAWGSSDLILAGTPIDHGDGTESRTYRATQPLSSEAQRAFRLRVALQ